LPVRTRLGITPLLVVPYTLDAKRHALRHTAGLQRGDQFFAYLKDAFDVLYAEGDPQGQDARR